MSLFGARVVGVLGLLGLLSGCGPLALLNLLAAMQEERVTEIQPLATSITPITSLAAPSSGMVYSGESYQVACNISGTVTLYPVVHDGTAWEPPYQGYGCIMTEGTDGQAQCIFPARTGTGLTWNVFRTGSGSVSSCLASGRAGPVPSSRAAPASGPGSGTVTSIECLTGLTCTPDPITAAGTIAVADTAVTPGAYGSATQVGTFTVDQQGRLVLAGNTTITGTTPGGAASGDLSGTYPGPTVARINGVALGSTTATAGNLLIGSGTEWVTQAMTGDAAIAANGALTFATVNGNVGTFGSATQVAQITANAKGLITAVTNVTITGTSPGGAAGGDLAGTYPNPTIAALQGNVCATGTIFYGQTASAPICSTTTWPNAATTGDLLAATGANAIGRIADVATGQLLASGGVGALPAYTATPTVTTLNATTGYKVNGAAASGTFLRGDGTNYVNSTTTIPNSANTGDVLCATGANTYGACAPGAAGTILTSTGAGAQPTFQAPSTDGANLTNVYAGVVTGGANTGIGGGVTKWLVSPGDGVAASAAETPIFVMPADGLLGALHCRVSTNCGTGEQIVFTLQTSTDNGSVWGNTANACTIAGATDVRCTGATNVAVAADAIVAIKSVSSGSCAVFNAVCTFTVAKQ